MVARKYIKSFLVLLAMLVLIFIEILSLTFSTFVTMDWHEIPIISHNSIFIILLFLLSLMSLIIIQPILDKIPPRKIFFVCFSIYFIMGLYLVTNVDTKLSLSDPFFCINAANQFNHGNYVALSKGQYLGVYPFQLFWVSLLRIPLMLTSSIRVMYLLNFFLVLLAFYICYRMSMLISNKNNTVNTVVILYFCFLPNLYHSVFIYNNVPAYTLFLISIYFFIKSFKKKGKVTYCYISVVIAVFAYFVKNNFLIGIIAILLSYWLSNLKLKSKLIITIIGIICVFAINFIIMGYYSLTTNSNIEKGVPKTAYVVMGLQQSGSKYGRFNGYTVDLLKANNYLLSKSDQVAKKDLLKRIKYFENHPENATEFFARKLITTWTDPLFQSIWDGPLETNGAKYQSKIISSIYSINGKGKIAKFSFALSKINILIILTMALYGSFKLFTNSVKNNVLSNYGFFVLTFLLGGFTFHFFWETKSQYVWQYVDLLIPYSGIMLSFLSDSIREKINLLK